ncbi:hypothetical protein [Chamaesiphon minutus]|uniref:hypothetical protein n=1 Tax=Chamaesiphon minutus TaxID=1173032 RepID=UPI00059F5FAE|nr:hypothetical protein [Chamaesiphon minutus]
MFETYGAIASYLSTNHTLSYLNLGRVKLGDRSQFLLFDALTNNRTLTHLFVSGKLIQKLPRYSQPNARSLLLQTTI